MTQTEYEQKRDECWKDFWEAIKISRIDCNFWRQTFEDTYLTGFNKGFALAHGKEYTDAVFGEQEKDEVKPTESGRFEPKHHIPDPRKCSTASSGDGFREHNRLHIAAMLCAGILANRKLTEWQDIDREAHPKIVKASLRYADALMKAAGEGGGE